MKIAPIVSSLLAVPSVLGFKQTSKVVRRLNQDEDQEEDEYEFLQNYEQVYVTCDPNQKVYNENGEAEYGAVVYRLCPQGTGCDEDGKICSAGHGDYVVGIETYMRQFMEQFQQEQENNGNNNGDDENQFDVAEFGECREYDIENDNDNGGNDDQQEDQYFVGPLCDNGNIRIAFFKGDGNENAAEGAECVPENESEVSFESLTGISLPWSTSILEDDICKSYYCYGQDENGDYDYNEFCVELYEEAQTKCEADMEFYSPYGQNVQGCETIQAMLPVESGKSGAGWFVFAILVVAVVGFGIWYFLQQKKKSAVNQEGLMM